MDFITVRVEGGWHARDADTNLTYFGSTEAEATSRLKAAKEVFIELRRRAREERYAAPKAVLSV